jgi:hypothetical protein
VRVPHRDAKNVRWGGGGGPMKQKCHILKVELYT